MKQNKRKCPSRIKMHTEAERRAYSFLPDTAKDYFCRNRKVRFAKRHVFYPDLLLPEAKIVIEIDGSIHDKEKKQKKDRKKDKEFTEHGYTMIRFKNAETKCETSFQYKLYNELLRIDDIKERPFGKELLEGLEDLLYAIDEEEYGIEESEFSLYGMTVRME